MRADRLVAILLLLQTRGSVTAAEVAAELEVSLKTARRDLEALSLAGIPVYSQPGRGGGWRLLGGGRTDLSGLTAAEVRALFLVAGPLSTVTPEAKSALRKLARALPETFRAAAAAAAAAMVFDPTSWGAIQAPTSPHLADLQRAVIEQVQVRLAYADHTGASSERLVHPLGLATKGGVWYLIADTAAGRRTFRVSRIRSVVLTDLPAVRPEGFDLTAAWQSIAATVEERRTRVRAIVNVDAAVLAGLRVQFGADVAVGKRLAEGRFEARISGSSPREIAERLAGWGKAIDVVGPKEVRRHLAQIGAELVEAHGRSSHRSRKSTGERRKS
ncbi:MAG: helix-turn-helix transcriptional regulator [Thermomicrobiales bacterium]